MSNLGSKNSGDVEPFISVIIPVFNAETTLKKALDSVLSQKGVICEVICIDDGSTDNSSMILNNYAKNNSNIKIIQQANCGAGIARNRGIDAAEGEFIAFLDPDDFYFDSWSLQILYEVLKKEAVLVAGGSVSPFRLSDSTEISPSKNMVYKTNGVMTFAQAQNPFFFQRYLIKREILDRYNVRFPPYRRYQDPPFIARVLHYAKYFAVTNCFVYKYAVQPNHVEWSFVKIRDAYSGIENLTAFSTQHNYRALCSTALAGIYNMDLFERAMRCDRNQKKELIEIFERIRASIKREKFLKEFLYIIDKQIRWLKDDKLPNKVQSRLPLFLARVFSKVKRFFINV